MLREFKECDILFPDRIENADGAVASICQTNDVSARPSKLSLQWLDLLGGRMEMLLEKRLQNIHAAQR